MPPSVDDSEFTLFFDGACYPNPGESMGLGVVILVGAKTLRELSVPLREPGSNNVAEYRALIRGMEEALALGARNLGVKGDSQLVIRQMKGEYAVRDPRLATLHLEARALEGEFDRVRYVHVPREENSRADRLSKDAAGMPAPDRGAGGGGARDADDRCPRCGAKLVVTTQRFRDGRTHLRGECPSHGFVKYVKKPDPGRKD